MQQFITGFIVAVALSVPIFLILLRNRTAQGYSREKGHIEQIEELSRLAGGLAHEIKNPLSTVKVNLRLITEDWDKNDEKFAKSLRKIGIIQKETDRLEQILDDFLKYVGRTEIHPLPVDLNELLGDMVDFYSPQAHSHSITIRAGLYGQPLICKVDGDMLKQVILNLFINAQQAMSSGGELIIRTHKDKNCAIIEISDTGTGIEPERLDKIFDAYYSTRPTGSGLGLSTARKIVEAHNGRITVRSEPGRGTQFTIRLPLHVG